MNKAIKIDIYSQHKRNTARHGPLLYKLDYKLRASKCNLLSDNFVIIIIIFFNILLQGYGELPNDATGQKQAPVIFTLSTHPLESVCSSILVKTTLTHKLKYVEII